MKKIKNEIIIDISNIIIPIPHTQQTMDWSCGAACLTSIINYYSYKQDDEETVGKKIKMTEDGVDPYQITDFLKKKEYELDWKEHTNMKVEMLKSCIINGHPVMIMIQAWETVKENEYKNTWHNGHWVVAIGFDEDNFYFMDPCEDIDCTIGFINYKVDNNFSLSNRWHDIEAKELNGKTMKTDNYGIEIWGKKNKFVAKLIK